MERDLVLCAIGSCGGRSRPWLSSVTTLGSWEAACGGGVAVKVSRRGKTGQGSCTGQDVWMAEARIGGGVQAGAGERMLEGGEGLATLGGSRLGTLGCPGDRMRAWLGGGGSRRRHASKRSCRLAMASTWVMVEGGGASLRALDMTWRPWMILSSGVGEGMVW